MEGGTSQHYPRAYRRMSRDTNFYYSFLVLPREKRDAIVAVWDFCRAVDDAADEAASSALAAEAVKRWRSCACAVGETVQPATGGVRRAD